MVCLETWTYDPNAAGRTIWGGPLHGSPADVYYYQSWGNIYDDGYDQELQHNNANHIG